MGEWGLNATNTLHVIAEALKASFAAGERYIADPDSMSAIPTGDLISNAWAADLARHLSLDDADPSFAPDSSPDDGAGCTTHYSIIDHWGNICSATHTIGLFWGSGMVLDGHRVASQRRNERLFRRPRPHQRRGSRQDPPQPHVPDHRVQGRPTLHDSWIARQSPHPIRRAADRFQRHRP